MVRFALFRPITILVLFLGLLILSIVAVKTIPIDIFPRLNSPTIYVIEQYGGMSAKQMEGFFCTRMQDQFLYVNGVKTIESKNIQGLTLLKLSFYENVNMAEATGQVALQSSRMLANFPANSLPPTILRFDASSLPVGELVFRSESKSLQEMLDFALTRVRPLFATVSGLSAAPPFGSNQRSVIINVDPKKLSTYNLTADEIVDAVVKNNTITPSGNIRIDSTMFITTVNSLEDKIKQFESISVKTNGSTSVSLSDVARVEDGADVTVDYALVNGKRSVYIPVVKTADASTWDVVQKLRAKLPEMQSLLPDDIKISYEFDQSIFVINAAKSLMTEGILGAVLTGLMVLLFLRDWRSSVVVIITIPISVLSAVFFLNLCGQTVNIMTLSGLALAIGVLVDQATVTIENIHQHLEMGKTKRQAILDACEEVSFPLILILLCILAVFAPTFVMSGVPKAMFLPLSLSIAFAMVVSFIAAQTLVPVLSNWLLKAEMFKHAHAGLVLNENEIIEVNTHNESEKSQPKKNDFFQKLKQNLANLLSRWLGFKKLIVMAYLLIVTGAALLCFVFIGKDLLPKSNVGQLQIRLREPDGTRLEITERATKSVLDIIDSTVQHHVAITSAFVGVVPSNFGTSNLYIFNSGSHEAIIQINLDENFKGNIENLKEVLRQKIYAAFPNIKISYEPIELTEKIMAQGANNPIEVRIAGKNMADIKIYSAQLLTKLKEISFLRDVQMAQPLNVPTVNINLDREKLALMGLSLEQVARSITASTSSSRLTAKNFWLDSKTSYTYQMQVQIPEYAMNSFEALQAIPLVKGQARPILSEVATLLLENSPGEYDRSGPRRFVTLGANIHKKDLGSATASVKKAIAAVGAPPIGLITEIKGTSELLTETLDALQTGLIAAIVVILLLLAANYQSFGVALSVLSTVPAVLLGAMLMLFATGSTLNLQSYMGLIMAVGVSIANAILIVTNAETLRLEYKDASKAATVAASIRLRPILMTSLAMIAGMIPMAIGFGESGDQSAPLGRAVIGGLAASTVAALFIVPLVYAWVQQKKGFTSVSLMP